VEPIVTQASDSEQDDELTAEDRAQLEVINRWHEQRRQRPGPEHIAGIARVLAPVFKKNRWRWRGKVPDAPRIAIALSRMVDYLADTGVEWTSSGRLTVRRDEDGDYAFSLKLPTWFAPRPEPTLEELAAEREAAGREATRLQLAVARNARRPTR
jgi:hypothetical protein